MREAQGIAEALLLLSTGSLLTVSIATLTIAIFALRHARRYVQLAEGRMEHLREENARLLVLLNKSRRSREEPGQGRGQRAGVQQEYGRREDLARRDAERKIDEVRRELLGLSEKGRESVSPPAEGPLETPARGRGRLIDEAWTTQKVRRARTSRAKTLSEPAGVPPENKKQRHAVWHPHPDDDVNPGKASTGQTGIQSVAPLKMFHRYYDRYLDNYEGYVKLVQRLYLVRDRGEVPAASAAEREWREKLRRATDGIERTTARLDLLEEYNPELATDERVSRRASVARSHSELEKSRWTVESVKDFGSPSPNGPMGSLGGRTESIT